MKEEKDSLKHSVDAFLRELENDSRPPEPPEPPEPPKKYSVDPRAIIPTHKIKSYKDDCFSVAVPKCYRVGIRQYLGEQQNDIFQIISQHKKNILQANAGTGKNTLMINLAKSGLVQKLECERLIIVVMVTTVGAQSQKDFAKQGIDAYFVSGVGDKYEKGVSDYELGSAKVVIVVADSLPKIEPLIKDSFLVIDEFDSVGRQASKTFRAVAMGQAFKYSQIAKRVLLMSATPDLLYTTNLHKGFNYNLIKCVDSAPNRKKLTFVECSDKISRIEKLEYLENLEVAEGTIIIKLDNDILNEEQRKLYEKYGVTVDYFTSKRTERKEQNPNYQSLVSTGFFAENIDVILTTKLIDTGVSIKNPVALVGSLDSRSWQEIVQLSARPRHNVKTGANMNVPIVVFVPEQTKPSQTNKTRIEQRFCDLLAETKAFCKAANSFGFGESTSRTSGDIQHLAVIDSGSYYPSIPQILNELHRQETNETDLQLLKTKIERIDKRFDIDIVKFQKVEISPDLQQLQANINTVRDIQKQFRADYIELLKSNTTDTVNAYLVLSKNIKQRATLQGIFKTGLLNKHSVSNFVEKNPVAVACKDKGKIINYLAKLIDIGVDKKTVFEILATKKQGELKEFSDSKIVAWRHKNSSWLGARENMECEVDKAVISGINKAEQNRKQGKYKNGITKKIIINIVKKRATKITDIYKNPILTNTQCLSRLRTLFEFETERKTIKGKKIQFYKEFKCKIELRGKKPQKKSDM